MINFYLNNNFNNIKLVSNYFYHCTAYRKINLMKITVSIKNKMALSYISEYISRSNIKLLRIKTNYKIVCSSMT